MTSPNILQTALTHLARNSSSLTDGEVAALDLLCAASERRYNGDLVFVAVIAGGVGPDVWDDHLEFKASNMIAALAHAEEAAEARGGATVSIEQKD